MRLVTTKSSLTPLHTTYSGDADIVFNGRKDTSEDGFVSWLEEYLDNPSQATINGYSCLYLSQKVTGDDILSIDTTNKVEATTLCTNLEILSSDLVLVLSGNDCAFEYRKLIKERDLLKTVFEIEFVDGDRITISHMDEGIKKYLALSNLTGGNLHFVNLEDLSTYGNNQFLYYKYDYNIDTTLGRLLLFTTDLDNNQYLIKFSDNKLEPIPLSGNPAYDASFFTINYYFDFPTPKINSSWVSYDKNAINTQKIDIKKSRYSLKNNYLINTQYTNLTSDNLNANILFLKNQNTLNDLSYRSAYNEFTDVLYPNVDNRNYIGMMTGNKQEGSSYNISFSYEMNSLDYKFTADRYTAFKTLSSLFPFEYLSINDTNFYRSGAIAGDSPYTSDKVFKKIARSYGEDIYTCTWLSAGKNGDSLWVDRYFKPDNSGNFTPIDNFLNKKLPVTGYYDAFDLFNSIEEELANTPQTLSLVLTGHRFFDKPSDMTFDPNSEYVYFRIGNSYVQKYLNTINENLILSSFNVKDTKGGNINNVEYEEFQFDGKNYAKFDRYDLINQSHQYTINFWLKSSDWKKGFGHQIFGNLNTNGIALISDPKVTPFIMVQNNRGVNIYNTNFDILDTVFTGLEKRIYEIHRTDHLSPYYTVLQ